MWWNPFTWDMAAVAQTAVGAGFGTAAISGLLNLVRNYRHKSDLGAYLSLQLAVNLESYALKCADFCGDNRNAPHAPDEEFPNWNVNLPTLVAFPADADGWRALDRKLASRCMNLPNEISSAQGMIHSTAEYNTDDLGDELELRSASLGLKAWELARELRAKYHLGSPDLDWDFPEVLRLSAKDADEAIEKRRKESLKFFNSK
jgi:hypothetical protein